MDASLTLLALIVLVLVIRLIVAGAGSPIQANRGSPQSYLGLAEEGLPTGKRFGELLRDARTAKGLTQREVAKLLCISRQRYQRIESGEVLPPDDNLLLSRFASILSIELDRLCTFRRLDRDRAHKMQLLVDGYQQVIKDLPILDVVRALRRALDEVGTAREREAFERLAVQPIMNLGPEGLTRDDTSDVSADAVISNVTHFMANHRRQKVVAKAIEHLTQEMHQDPESDAYAHPRPIQLLLDFATELRAPWLFPSDIEESASGFLDTQPSRAGELFAPPVDVIRLIEEHPRLTLLPLDPGRCWTRDGRPYLGQASWAKDGSQVIIAISSALFDAKDDPTRRRCRFTLAHEVGHAVLHLLPMQPGSVPRMMAEERTKVERQAYWFAASLLMPSSIIFRSLFETCGHPIRKGASWTAWIGDVGRRPVVFGGAKFDSMVEMFDVNPQPLRIRLEHLIGPRS